MFIVLTTLRDQIFNVNLLIIQEMEVCTFTVILKDFMQNTHVILDIMWLEVEQDNVYRRVGLELFPPVMVYVLTITN